ncbi:Uncharacterised protein [Mycobacteroides abscessus]|nr:Uncharacterised protein [Mycobacteroides abscessus]
MNNTIQIKYGISNKRLVLRIFNILITFNTFIKFFFRFTWYHDMNCFWLKIQANFTAYFSFTC